MAEDKFFLKVNITDARTYHVDKDGNEILETSEPKVIKAEEETKEE